MGDVISFAGARARRDATPATVATPGRRLTVSFAFDLALPETYFAADRLERMLGRVAWVPASSVALHGGRDGRDAGLLGRREAVEARARTLRMPLVWPERYPFDGRAAMRIAALAVVLGRAAEFTLAASRLAFCGGYDLDDLEVLAEAAAAAGLPLDSCLAAAGDRTIDAALEVSATALRSRGADRLPAMTVGGRTICGEERLAEAAALARSPWRAGRAG